MPRVIEKDLLVGGFKIGTFNAYSEVEDELSITSDTPKLTRVLPAPFFYEKSLFFYLIHKWEPGEKSTFPNGGYEVRDDGGAMRSFDLDQLIIHPHLIKHKKTLDKMLRRAEKEQLKRDRQRKKGERERVQKPKSATGRRGRPAMDPELKAKRESDKADRAQKSGGRRGRPKSTTVKIISTNKTSGNKRGRPPLTAAAIAVKEASKASITKRSEGRRGRPKSRL
jgi:hypothetical protein